MRTFPPKSRNTVVSKPNTERPINAKETYLKIHTHTYTYLTLTKQAAYQRLEEGDQSGNGKAWRGRV